LCASNSTLFFLIFISLLWVESIPNNRAENASK
jgi:hypothetical protein